LRHGVFFAFQGCRLVGIVGRKNPYGWRKTTGTMQSKGARVNDKEKLAIANYLASLQLYRAEFCK
jgi:hypothetical protein